MSDEKLTPVVIRMPADLHRAVKKKAAEEERSMAQAIRYALRCYVDDSFIALPQAYCNIIGHPAWKHECDGIGQRLRSGGVFG